MTKLEDTLKFAVQKMKANNLIPRHGEKAVDTAYWSEVLDPDHKPGHGRTGNVAYLDDKKREAYVVGFEGVCLKVKPMSRFKIGITQTTKGQLIWVIDRERNFYAGVKSIGNFHHSSFLSGSQVLAAGSMEIESGYKIVQVNNHSGHYKPDLPQLKLAATVMKLQGADIDNIPFLYSPPPGKGVPMPFDNGRAMIHHEA